MQTIDNIPVHFTYTKYGQLESKVMGDDIKNPIGSLKYYYEKDGTLIGRVVNGSVQNFAYDKKSQLIKVTDLAGKVLESYTYDNAGNILEKVINDKKTVYTYDKANQLVTATDADGKNTSYKYDAAGRLSQEASTEATKNYSYGWLDKVTKVDNGTAQSVFNYFPDGQLAEKVVGSDTERFYWDGLALIKRDSREFTNEPAVTGGNPVIANNKVMLNDMLGNSIGAYDKEYQAIDRTAFGETTAKSDIDFFTGKPNVEGLGYSFLFRNYRQDLGKWQTSDPLGYPDGWNNLAYCNNRLSAYIDKLGGKKYFVLGDLQQKYDGGASEVIGDEDIYYFTADIYLSGAANKSTTASLSFNFDFDFFGQNDDFYDMGDLLQGSISIRNPDNPNIQGTSYFNKSTSDYAMNVSMDLYNSANAATVWINWSVAVTGTAFDPATLAGTFMYSFRIQEFPE